jgi:hypothetical protein
MKNLILTFALLFLSISVKAQWNGTNPITTSSTVGIFTTNPQASFHISPTYTGGIYPLLGPLALVDYSQSGVTTTVFSAMNNGNFGVGVSSPLHKFHVVGNSFLDGTTQLNGNTTIVGSLKINDGTSNQFSVNNTGLLIARQIDVHLDPIPDYVFHSAFDKDSADIYKLNGSYEMLSIDEVDSFVRENRHLPGIKSAQDYAESGSINLGELNLKLLEKVEELTLYTIQLKKEIEELRKQQELIGKKAKQE